MKKSRHSNWHQNHTFAEIKSKGTQYSPSMRYLDRRFDSFHFFALFSKDTILFFSLRTVFCKTVQLLQPVPSKGSGALWTETCITSACYSSTISSPSDTSTTGDSTIFCTSEHAIVDWTVVEVSVTLAGFALLAMGSLCDWSEQSASWVAIAALIAYENTSVVDKGELKIKRQKVKRCYVINDSPFASLALMAFPSILPFQLCGLLEKHNNQTRPCEATVASIFLLVHRGQISVQNPQVWNAQSISLSASMAPTWPSSALQNLPISSFFSWLPDDHPRKMELREATYL